MTVYKPGDILLLRFPFTGASGGKQRPALVLLDANDSDIVVARVTSQTYSTPYDAPLTEWSAAGLLAASTVRLHKLATIEKTLVKRQLGQLAASDLAAIQTMLSDLFAGFA